MDPRLERGVDAFNAGKFFLAHEIWEALWLETVGPEKVLLQGLVQIAAGYAKLESGVHGGAVKLLARGLERVRQYPPTALGLRLGPFVEGVEADLQRLRVTAQEVGCSTTSEGPVCCVSSYPVRSRASSTASGAWDESRSAAWSRTSAWHVCPGRELVTFIVVSGLS